MTASDLDFADVEIWIDGVARGERTMSQRHLRRLERVAGGIAAVCAAPSGRGVHLAVILDDAGVEVVAASRHPIRVLC